MRQTIIVILLFFASGMQAQVQLPPYTVTQDSATHTTVVMTDGTQFRRIKSDPDTGPLVKIAPDIKIKTGIVDYKAITGELYVRKYYLNNALLGYVEYDGKNMKREIYYNAQGNINRETRYDKGYLIYSDNKVQIPQKK